MQPQQQLRPIATTQVQPAIDRDTASLRPTETRYGWCPYGDINLFGPSGSPTLYVQPHEIDSGFGNVPNPFHRLLPKNQLIPFPTFNVIEQTPSPDLKDNQGRAVLVTATRTMTALDAAVWVLRGYSSWGFTILNSLQGLEQGVAMRIFQVVQPFQYPLSQIVNELTFGALDRIDSNIVLTWADQPGYEVQPLVDDDERAIARKLAEEMAAGAQIAYDLATDTLNETEASMTQRFAGGQGKSGGDPLDRRLAEELDRELPKMVGTSNKQQEIETKLDFLVGREASRADKEKITELQAELDALKAGKVETPAAAETDAEVKTCGAIKANGDPCGTVTSGGRCAHHKEVE